MCDLYGNLIIVSGGKLMICCCILVLEEGKIIIQVGGEFIFDGGYFYQDCGGFW